MPGDEASPVGKLAGLQVLDDNEPAAAGAAVERHSGSWKDKKPHQVEVEGWAGGEEDEQGDGEDGSESESSSARTSWSISSARLVPPSPMRGEALRGGMPTAERKTLKRSQSTLTPFTRKKDGEAVVESVTAELESKGLMLDLAHFRYGEDSKVLGQGAMGTLYRGATDEREVSAGKLWGVEGGRNVPIFSAAS